jgi:hypothetical protein
MCPRPQVTLYMAAQTNSVASAEGNKLEVNNGLIDNLKAELKKVKADLADELDRVKAEINRISALKQTVDPKSFA